MKKIIYSLITACLIFSCQDDDGTDPKERKICKIQQTNLLNNDNPNVSGFIEEYIYESNKLKKIIQIDVDGEVDSAIYLYNSFNQLTTVLVSYYSTNQLDTTEKYVYNQNGQLTKAYYLDEGIATGTSTFTYKNGSLDEFLTEYTHSESERYKIKMNEGNITEIMGIDSLGNADPKDKIVFTYDNGFNPYQFLPSSNEGINPLLYFNLRNLKSIQYYESDTLIFQSNTKYKYNSFNYPTEILEYIDGDTLLTKISYQCE